MTSLMQDFEEWAHLRHRHASAETPAAAVTIGSSTQEDPVTLIAEAKTALHDGLAKLESFDESALAKLEAVQAHPEALDAFDTLASLAGLGNLPAGAIATATSVLKMTLGMLAPQQPAPADVPEPQPVPAGPQVAGQA